MEKNVNLSPECICDRGSTGNNRAGKRSRENAYTYKVTLSAGNKGSISGQEKIEVQDLNAGDDVSFDLSQIQVTDEKYYVKGIRLSGRDNAEALAAPAFNVDGDADYVVAYGIKGNQVAYTVQYQDEDGPTHWQKSQTFYGNVGDKPVVAYRYIEKFYSAGTGTDQNPE